MQGADDGCIKVETYAGDDGYSIILIEDWKTKKHQQSQFQWNVDTGMEDAIVMFASAPSEIKYYEIRSEQIFVPWQKARPAIT